MTLLRKHEWKYISDTTFGNRLARKVGTRYVIHRRGKLTGPKTVQETLVPPTKTSGGAAVWNQETLLPYTIRSYGD